jgi:ADP-ribosylglycohydrolase
MNQADRVLGTILGAACGDALGATVEFLSPEEIARSFPDGHREMIGGGPFNVLPGQFTDDTELAIALANSIVEAKGYDPDAAARHYAAWYRSGPFDCGGTCARAFGHPSEPSSLMRKRASKTSEANGCLMRIWPLGVWAALTDRLGDVRSAAISDALLSHPATAPGVAAFAHAIGVAILTGDREATLDVLTSSLRRSRLEHGLFEDPGDVTDHAGWYLHALRLAVFELDRVGRDTTVEESIVSVVARGGDTDTNGAIVGAILGAVYGRTALPDRWGTAITHCETSRPYRLDVDSIERIVDGLMEATR